MKRFSVFAKVIRNGVQTHLHSIAIWADTEEEAIKKYKSTNPEDIVTSCFAH